MNLLSRKRWVIADPPKDALLALNVTDELLARFLYNRGYRSANAVKRFLQPTDVLSPSPFSLPGVHEAVGVLRYAISKGKHIVIYGDYDVDGLTSTALLCEGLRRLGASVTPFIPNRLETGYGLDCSAIRSLASSADVLLTVDCGIRSLDEIALAHSLGMAVVITDHHLPGTELPKADAVITTRLPGHSFGDLAGVGIAAVLLQALYSVHSRFCDTKLSADNALDLVALGTVADIAPLKDENRRFVCQGLEKLRRSPRLGLKALMQRAGLDPMIVGVEQISFALAPRINSVGRLGSADPALKLLLSEDESEATTLADTMESANNERKRHLEENLAWARQELSSHPPTSNLIFSANTDYLPGIVGLVASRLTDEWGLPSVAVAIEGDAAHGSMRSVNGFNASEALDRCSHLLRKHGGHTLAAGFSCSATALPELQANLEAIAGPYDATGDRRPLLKVDAEVPLLSRQSDVWHWLPLIQPTGNANEPPVFVSRNVKVRECRCIGRDGTHLILSLAQSEDIRAVAFRMGTLAGQMPGNVDIAYQLEENYFNGTIERRLLLLDIAETGVEASV